MTTLDKLNALAANGWWSWNPDVLSLFERLNPSAFAAAKNNPYAALEEPDRSVVDEESYVEEVDAAYARLNDYLESTPRIEDAPRTSYFCMEYGLHESMPLYSGGLGILAGDHAKAASDLGIPFTAVGFLLREGYFEQYFDEEGTQHARHEAMQTERHPLTLVTDEEGDPLRVGVHIGKKRVQLQAWRLDLGRTTLYLLDTDHDGNQEPLRSLSRRLYQGDSKTRIQQEILLGIGGLRLLRALDVETDVFHMNEGHCAFLALELLRERLDAGDTRPEAEQWVIENCIFTTHTPVLAGHDRFDPALFNQQMAGFRNRIGLSKKDLLAYGRVDPTDKAEWFCMTVLGLKLARSANGVSRLNGHVAREQWHDLFPDLEQNEVPIDYITNGIHLPTWTHPEARSFIETHLGDWKTHRTDPAFWEKITEVSDEELWALRGRLRQILIDYAGTHTAEQTLPQHPGLDPDALTIGFARRFATYKRAPLLFSDEERAIRLFADTERPIQVLYAGKAHPADEGGKAFIRRIYEMSQHPEIKGKLLFLENYDMEVGRHLIAGCDVWLNNPRRPMEASGTSGQKIAAHGGLNVSILDGWWPEGYNGENGWPIGHADDTPKEKEVQDAEDAAALYAVLEEEVIPTFYDRDDAGIPRGWVAQMREAMRTLTHQFSAARMVTDYVETMYRPAEVAETA